MAEEIVAQLNQVLIFFDFRGLLNAQSGRVGLYCYKRKDGLQLLSGI